MAGAGLADVVDIRLLIVVASSLLFVSAGFTLVAPGLGVSTWRAAASARLREAEGAPALAGTPVRPATLRRLRPAGRSASRRSAGSPRPARRRSSATRRSARSRPGRASWSTATRRDSAYFILDGQATAGIPDDGGYRGLPTMGAGDFFGEIAALTGSPRTADVVADTDTTLLEVPADGAARDDDGAGDPAKLVLSTMTSRLLRTESADLPRLAGVDQEELRDLRTPRPSVEALPRTYRERGDPDLCGS